MNYPDVPGRDKFLKSAKHPEGRFKLGDVVVENGPTNRWIGVIVPLPTYVGVGGPEDADAGIQWLFIDGDGSIPEIMKVLDCTRLYCIAERMDDNAGRIPDRMFGI